jgi:hypothetical protein
MALSKLTLTNGEWKKISLAGQDGTAWLKSYSGVNPVIVIAHTDDAQTYDIPDDDPDAGVVDDNIPYASAVGLDVDASYRLPYMDMRISDPLTADNNNDVFYATILNTGATCEIVVDFV